MPGNFRVKSDVWLAMQGGQPNHMGFDRGTSVDEGVAYTFELATGTTDQVFIVIDPAPDSGGIETVTCLAIVADQTISLKLGAAGSNVAFTMTANEPVILQGISVTEASVSNSSGSTANVRVMIAGT